MKKLLSLFMVLGLVACGNKEPKAETKSPATPPTTTQTTTVTANTTATAMPTPSPTNTATATANSVHTVDYYSNNFEAMKAKITDCKSRIVTAQDVEKIKQNEPDCKNAFEAYQKYSTKFNSSENTKHHASVRAFPDKQ